MLLITSCSTVQGIYARQTFEFKNDTSDSRIFYEAGTEDAAAVISENLSNHIELIEKLQYGRFSDSSKIRVYIFNDIKRYSTFGYGTGSSSLGGATTNEVLISVPRIRERLLSNLCQNASCPESVESILIHELSHIHIRQFLGTWRYVSDVPQWFHEGLATLVSSGAGAGLVSEAEVKKSIFSGSHLLPHDSGRLLARAETTGELRFGSFDFYRQSELFVEFLRDTNPRGFKKVLNEIRDRQKFSTVWRTHYESDISELWSAFKLNL